MRAQQRIAEPLAPFVLIVEDDPDTRDLYGMYFLGCGFRVQTAENGDVAVSRALASRPDVIVMDLSLPLLDGWEATRRIKSDSRTALIPIVACTAHEVGGAVERAIEAGCDAYVVKPCLPQDLLREVQRVLHRSAEGHQRRA